MLARPTPSLAAHPAERPRERMFLYGPEQLADVELVALVLGGGESLRRAHGILDQLGGLRGLESATPHELLGLPGIGDATATALAASVELTRRLGRLSLPWSEPIRNPTEAAEFVRAALRGATQEHFLCVGLDSRQRVRLLRTAAVGSLSQVEVHPRELFRPLVRAGMHACILVHNHPSGDAQPSEADVELTRRMVEVGELVGVPVLDHIVVTDAEAVSLAALGLV